MASPTISSPSPASSFMSTHRDAGAYFVPLPETKGKFDLAAYQEQLAEGYRLKKTPAEFYNDVMYDMSAKIYFQALANKNAMVANPTNGLTQAQISSAWSNWSKQFMQVNPIFADALTSSNG